MGVYHLTENGPERGKLSTAAVTGEKVGKLAYGDGSGHVVGMQTPTSRSMEPSEQCGSGNY